MAAKKDDTKTDSKTPVSASPDTIGHAAGKIQVELSTRFLEHFSEQLYSSPQKAFEELISNGWDAGADCVDVRVAVDLSAQDATMSVLDNGVSMDEEGLRQLWHIAFSPKSGEPFQYGRQVIGKFGIGKLATYVLCRKLTYICKASDGKIRRVTMNYGELDRQKGAAPDRLISDLELQVYEVTDSELAAALGSVCDGGAILDLIRKGVPRPAGDLAQDEFGAEKSKLDRPAAGTWTLVILSDLKPTGRQLKLGVLRRMLQAALPFGSEMAITLNGTLLVSSKVDAAIKKEWEIGPGLGISFIEVRTPEEETPGDPKVARNQTGSKQPAEMVATKLAIASGTDPVPHVDLPGIGRVTGRVVLFDEPISIGKSEERGASNGFHINVLGRVVNQRDPSFGEENLSHAAWARFRMTARADGLNAFLTTDREKFRESQELRTFRAFLRSAFNKARSLYDSDEEAGMPHGGDVLVRSLGVLSLNPLRNVVSETLKSKRSVLPGLFDETGITDREERRKSWREDTADNIRNALGQVKYERIADDTFVKFRIADNTMLINKDHPFVAEYSRTRAEKELMRTVAMVSFLSDVYALDIGVLPTVLQSIRDYRDRLMRFRALQQRRSGTYIAKLLLKTQHDSSNSKLLEAVLSDALRYLGFSVEDMAKSGEPEGVARAFATPTLARPTQDKPNPPLYSFTFDAKSSKYEVAATGNMNLAGLADHRQQHGADYSLLVAPGFSGEAIGDRCAIVKVTPMAAVDLGRLLECTVEYGAIPLTKIREVFFLYDPVAVSAWVMNLETWLKQQRPLTLDIFLKALENLKGKVPDVLPAATIALECRQVLGAVSVVNSDVIAVATGLSILVPDLVGVDGDKIAVNASAARVAAAVAAQLENLRSDEPVTSDGDSG